MQDNEPLMRSLAKLIAHNRPDLVLFVGEALVGNDAVDQVLGLIALFCLTAWKFEKKMNSENEA